MLDEELAPDMIVARCNGGSGGAGVDILRPLHAPEAVPAEVAQFLHGLML